MQTLLITSSFDKTCDYIQVKFPELNYFRLNVDKFSSYKLEIIADGFRIECGEHQLFSSECSSIYFRKPVFENLDGNIDVQYHNFVHKESYSLIEGLIESFSGRCLSKPSVMRRANNKVFQIMLAKSVGFLMPQLSITNDEIVLKKWAKDDAIVKPLAIGTVEYKTKKEFVQTNRLSSEKDTSALKYAPVYLQKFVDKDYEVRVTAINGQFFPARIDASNPVDWRKPNTETLFTKCVLPENIEQQCRTYMYKSSMDFGCFDFLVKDNVWYFLEMNANGQWGWLDNLFEGKISDAIATYLKSGLKNAHC